MRRMQVGVKKDAADKSTSPTKTKKHIDPAQSNTLMNYFGKKPS
jgi:hypothetical protein